MAINVTLFFVSNLSLSVENIRSINKQKKIFTIKGLGNLKLYISVSEIKYGRESTLKIFNNEGMKKRNIANKMHEEFEKFNLLNILLIMKRKRKININSKNKIE